MPEYIDPQDGARARAASAEREQRKEGAKARAEEAAFTTHCRSSLYGDPYAAHRAHLDQVVHTDLTNRGVVDGQQLAEAKARAWEQVGAPVVVESPDIPLETFKAVFEQRGGAVRLTDDEIEERSEKLVGTLRKPLEYSAGQVRTDFAEVSAALQAKPALRKATEVMGTANSPFLMRGLVREHREGRGTLAPTATRPWNQPAAAAPAASAKPADPGASWPYK